MSVTVTTQAELDAALSSKERTIYIDSPRGVWLYVQDSGNSSVVARGNSSVVAWGNSSVVARGNSSVVARENSSVVARGNSSVVARENSSVVARENSSVEAAAYTAVFLHSQRVTLNAKGAVINMTTVDLSDPKTWAEFHGGDVKRGRLTVYKAVDSDLKAGHGYKPTEYPPGKEVKAPDWKASQACGNGLHFGITPHHARSYYNGTGTPRFLECTIRLADAVPLGDKIKAPSCKVVREVDLHRRPIGGAA